MKYTATIMLFLFSLTIQAQDTTVQFDGHKWRAPYLLPIPDGWTIERFLIPISFAPSIRYQGVEDIRFTPGWANAKSDEYWTYAFLWYLDGSVTLNRSQIEENLKSYYTGLVNINGSEISTEKLIPVVTSFREIKKEKNDARTFSGTVKMTDYMTQQPIVLNAKVHLRTCSGLKKTFVFYELSPQPFSHKVFTALAQLWTDFRCKYP